MITPMNGICLMIRMDFRRKNEREVVSGES